MTHCNDEDKANSAAMEDGKCTICKGKCAWNLHTNATFLLIPREVTKTVVPSDLIKQWNSNNNTLEGALLGAMDEYLKLQQELQRDIRYLVELTEKLEETALLHNPAAFVNYVETLIKTARARGASAEHISSLTAAKSSLQLAAELKQHGATRKMSQSEALTSILYDLRIEPTNRKEMPAEERVHVETQPRMLYNNLRGRLPKHLQDALPKLERGSCLRKDPVYSENLKMIVKLVQLVLRQRS